MGWKEQEKCQFWDPTSRQHEEIQRKTSFQLCRRGRM